MSDTPPKPILPLPTHSTFQYDPNLPGHIARRLRITLDPLLRGNVTVSPDVAAEADVRWDSERDTDRSVLDREEWRHFPLVGKSQLTENTARYRFALPNPTDALGLPVGQHVSLAADISGKRVVRSYTPTSLDNERGYFDLVVKTYPLGTVSQHLSTLRIGGSILARGPRGNFVYTPYSAACVLMIAGGSGITPMYQIIKSSVLDHPEDETELRLIYANIEEGDILLRNELDLLADKSHGRFRVYYVLDHPPPDWEGGSGYVSAQHISAQMEDANSNVEDCKVLLCGPPPMVAAMKTHLTQLGFAPPRHGPSQPDDRVFLF